LSGGNEGLRRETSGDVPTVFQPEFHVAAQGAAAPGDLDGIPPRERLGERAARGQPIEGVPDSPVVQLNLAPVEVNILKVVTSLNDGGTDVLHYEQLVPNDTDSNQPLVSRSDEAEPPRPSISPPQQEVSAEIDEAVLPARVWPWWLAGSGAALLVVAGVV